jgi:hypothetical protein
MPGLRQFIEGGGSPDDLSDGDIIGSADRLDHVVARDASHGFSPSVEGFPTAVKTKGCRTGFRAA